MRQAAYALVLLLCALATDAVADNQVDAGAISHSQVIIFQGTQFNLKDETSVKRLIDAFQAIPALNREMKTFFGVRLDQSERRTQASFDEIKHMLNENMLPLLKASKDSTELTERLHKANVANEKLRTEIESLRKQYQGDPEFSKVLEQAEQVLAARDYAGYHQVLARFSEQRKAKLVQYQQELAETAYLRSKEYHARLDYRAADQQAREATTYAPNNGAYWNWAGFIADDLGDYDQAIGYFEQALTIERKILGEEHSNIATGLNNLGLAYKTKGDYDRAIVYVEQALTIDRKMLGEEHPDTAIDYNNLGLAYGAKGEYDRAIEYYEQALAIDRNMLDEEHPQVAIRFNNLGAAFSNKGEYDLAIRYIEQALVIYRKTLGEEHPYVASSLNNLGAAYDAKDEHDLAIGYYEQALAIGSKTLGEAHPEHAARLNNLGLAYKAKGDYDRAIRYYEQALAVLTTQLGENHPKTLVVRGNLEAAKAKMAAQGSFVETL